jgi:uncharacterized membrane protein required for colicin V production
MAYGGVFVGVYLALYLLTRLLYSALTAVDLDGLDRWGGALLGAAKMVIVLAAVSLALAQGSHPTAADWLRQSTMAPVFAHGLEKAVAALPDEYKGRITQTWQEIGAWAQRGPTTKSQSSPLEGGGKI